MTLEEFGVDPDDRAYEEFPACDECGMKRPLFNHDGRSLCEECLRRAKGNLPSCHV